MKVEISSLNLIGTNIEFNFSNFNDMDKLIEISKEIEKVLKNHGVEIVYVS